MNGEALDHKTPLLRSQQAMAVQAERVLRLFGHQQPDAVVSFAGRSRSTSSSIGASSWRGPISTTPAARCSAEPPKGQEFDDHYFGAIPERCLGVHARRRAGALQARGSQPRRGTTKSRRDSSSWRRCSSARRLTRSSAAADGDPQASCAEARDGVPVPRKAIRWNQRLREARQLLAGNGSEGNLLLPGDTPHENAESSVPALAVIRAVHKMRDC